ncbi:glycosyltransferase, partial [Neisseria meningitidis]
KPVQRCLALPYYLYCLRLRRLVLIFVNPLYRQSGLDIYAWHGMYFFPRFPFIDIDRIRWVCAGLKAFKHYIRENGLPDLIHAHCMNYAGILAFKISQKYGIPYVVTEHSSTITRGLVRPHQWQPMKNAAAHAAARLAVSRHFAHVLQHKYGCEWQYLPQHTGRNIQPTV